MFPVAARPAASVTLAVTWASEPSLFSALTSELSPTVPTEGACVVSAQAKASATATTNQRAAVSTKVKKAEPELVGSR